MTYICDNLGLAVLNVIEELALFQLLNGLLPVTQFFLKVVHVVIQTMVDVFNVLSILVTMTPICKVSNNGTD